MDPMLRCQRDSRNDIQPTVTTFQSNLNLHLELYKQLSCVIKVETNIEKYNSEFIKKPLLDEHFDIILFYQYICISTTQRQRP